MGSADAYVIAPLLFPEMLGLSVFLWGFSCSSDTQTVLDLYQFTSYSLQSFQCHMPKAYLSPHILSRCAILALLLY